MPIEPKGIWDEKCVFEYDSHQIELQINKPREQHSLFIKNQGIEDPWNVGFRFLSEACWLFGIKINKINGGHSDYNTQINYTPSDFSYFMKLLRFKQKIHDPKQHLALGFFREGVSSDSPYYKLLCFAKILEIPFEEMNNKGKGGWIDAAIPKLKNSMAILYRDKKLKILGNQKLGDWLHQEMRHAIAHAQVSTSRQQVIRNPNDYEDWQETVWANTVMMELVTTLMIQQLKIPVDYVWEE